jgi:hypothetical protein
MLLASFFPKMAIFKKRDLLVRNLYRVMRSKSLSSLFVESCRTGLITDKRICPSKNFSMMHNCKRLQSPAMKQRNLYLQSIRYFSIFSASTLSSVVNLVFVLFCFNDYLMERSFLHHFISELHLLLFFSSTEIITVLVSFIV